MNRITCICGIALLAACSETTQPVDPAKDTVVLTAASPTNVTVVAGNNIPELPTVIAQDPNGVPRPGVVVNFSVTSGSSRIAGVTDTTNAAGIAQLGQWIPGTKAGETTTITAGSPNGSSVVFSATVLAGPPARIEKVEGDYQVGVAMNPTVIAPKARLTDFYSNPLPGVRINLSVIMGGGSVEPAVVETDAGGFFSASRWTLGALGEQVLGAQAGNISQVFHATAIAAVAGCSATTMFTLNTPLASVFGPDSCNSNGLYFTNYYVTLAQQLALNMEMHSSAFDPYLEIYDVNSRLIARNDDSGGSKDSGIRALLPAGIYRVVAYSKAPGVGGPYSLSSRLVTSGETGCEGMFVTKGDSTSAVLQSYTCGYDLVGGTNLYRVHLLAGESLTVTVRDLTYSGYAVDFLNEGGEEVASSVLENYYNYVTRYTASRDMVVTVRVQSMDNGAGFTIKFL